jgi:hypothetical protein
MSRGIYPVESGESVFEVQAVANKKGLVALVCKPAEGSPFPSSAQRKRIERQVNELHREHLIVFVDREQTRQVWQVPKREGGKTTGHSEVPYFKGKGVEHLARRIEAISFTLDESENVSLIEVAARVNQALLAEKVTKKFFKEFSDQRKAFLKFLDWIEDESKRDWYCSVLLNRLMFIYFIAEKGFLPEGKTFLSQRLETNAKVNGPDTFYTHFLLPLSFFGFGEPQGTRGRFEEQFKGVLYLNGGLFAVHSLERELGISKEAVESVTFPTGAMIPDSEFKKWFGYFDGWRWTLDEEKVENEGHISPHILGYIFEKYINQKQMGAYYTKEDITGYICRNTIIPRLFDMLAETGDKGKQAVDPLPIGPHPNLLNDGRGISFGEGIDRYVYRSVKQEEKLPTESDYERNERRSRYEAILGDFDAGKIRSIDDFITGNLDIEKLALDFVENIQDADVLHRFYFRGLQSITVLDPTCGSGAFLFAGLGILYPLYNAALSRMRYLVGKSTGVEPDVVNWAGRLNFDDLDSGQGVFADQVGGESKAIQEMKAEVERINDHPSAEYFIKKSIIVNNLFGVDIMEEAVEICKLRLFLSLIATVERDDAKPNLGVEPLPDIDFNILAGNTLIGYANIADIDRLWNEVEHGTQGKLAFEKDHSKLRDLCREYGKVLHAWRLQQLGEWRGTPVTKEQVLRAAECVRPELNEDIWRLFRTAGLGRKPSSGGATNRQNSDPTQAEFQLCCQPFHWLLEFPNIEANSGFEVILGNPPYVDWNTDSSYSVLGYYTLDSKNLYPWVMERSSVLLKRGGRFAMIIPLGGFATSRMVSHQKLLNREFPRSWVCHFSGDANPSRLFDGVKYRLSIFTGVLSDGDHWRRHVTGYIRWYAAERSSLFEQLSYTQLPDWDGYLSFARVVSPAHVGLLAQMKTQPKRLNSLFKSKGTGHLQYHRSPVSWIRVLNFEPFFKSETRSRSDDHVRDLWFENQGVANAAGAILASTLFYQWFISQGNCRDITTDELAHFPIPSLNDSQLAQLGELFDELMEDVKRNSRIRTYNYAASGIVRYQEFYFRQSAGIVRKLDQHIGLIYGLTGEQIDCLAHFDEKYRIGLVEEPLGPEGE